MTTKIITPQEVTPEMLVAGVESNETATNLPSRFQMVNGEIRYSVKYPLGRWMPATSNKQELAKTSNKWEWVDSIRFEEVQRYMEADTTDDTVWTTPIQETAQ